ncbi:amidohydrolase [Candidatus Bathyarchaeota archaeon]|nr:amidohydrolase [Candidatus Bathyarchaeota archaeon]
MRESSTDEKTSIALIGATLIDGTGRPALKNSTVIIDGNKIKEVGSKNQIKVPEKVTIIDLTGKTVTPGFIDSHYHYFIFSLSPRFIELSDTKSLQETLNRVEERANQLEPGEWIHGMGWDESNWPENRFITTEDLDATSPDNPVGLSRVDWHTIVFNTPALRFMEKTDRKLDSGDGQSSLNMMQKIFNYVNVTMPDITIDEWAEGLGNWAPYFFSHGSTGVHEPGLENRGVKAFQMAREKGVTLPRSYVMVMGDALESAVNQGGTHGSGDPFLTIGPAKFWIDGSLGSRSAALLEPYSDDLENIGTILLSGYKDECSKAHSNLMQTSTHAIGDRAVNEALDTIESVLGEYPRENHRHRIEHCELLGSEQIQRIRDLGVVAAMQPNFIGAWSILQPMYQQRLGEDRMRWCNPYRQLLDAGVVVAFGSDGMPFGPMFGVWGAVNHPVEESRISLVEAVKCYTLNCAYAAFQEDEVGSIEVGKYADIAVFNGDMTSIPASELHTVECYMTILDGKIVYQRNPP